MHGLYLKQRQMAKGLTILMVVFLGLTVTGTEGLAVHPSPLKAVFQTKALNEMVRRYRNKGYELSDQFANAFRYAKPREGSYDWGLYIYSLKRERDEDTSSSFVTITITIRYDAAAGGYRVTGYDLAEESL